MVWIKESNLFLWPLRFHMYYHYTNPNLILMLFLQNLMLESNQPISFISPDSTSCLMRYQFKILLPMGYGGRDRTSDLQVMSLTSYLCSTPRYLYNLISAGGRNRTCNHNDFHALMSSPAKQCSRYTVKPSFSNQLNSFQSSNSRNA